MPVCKFFLENRCMFGSNCWNEHVQPGRTNNQEFRVPPSNRYSSLDNQVHKFSQNNQMPNTSSLNSFSFKLTPASTHPVSRQEQRSHAGNESASDVIDFVVGEITEFDKGKMWRLSAFGPFRLNSNLSGFDDLSPEELRWGYCQTVDNERLRNEYLSLLYALNDEKNKRIREIIRPDQFTKSVLLKLYNGEHLQTLGVTSNMKKFLSLFVYNKPILGSESFKFSLDEARGPSTFKFSLDEAKGPSTFKFSLDSTAKSTDTVEEMMTQDIPSNNEKLSENTPSFQNFKLNPSRASDGILPKIKNDATDPKTNFLYTQLSSLTEKELAQFSATKFELGKIPSRPPPQDLCY